MLSGKELLREHNYRELWQKYCGFLDLSIGEFMSIQRSLLLEQLELLNRCDLGRHIMLGASPASVDEFRLTVPLTTYEDYVPYLSEQKEDALPAKPLLWQRTSGISGGRAFKWGPITERMYQAMRPLSFAILILATCKRRYDISFGEGESILYALAPPPFATGCWGRAIAEELPVSFQPPLAEAEEMTFEERLAQGMSRGLTEGIDLVFGMPSVLVALGERLAQQEHERANLLQLLSRPKALLRVIKAIVKSRIARRPIRPKDLWSLRGVATGGTDASLYKSRIKELWGKEPLDVYGSTEAMMIATQTWDHQGMTFVPNFNFLEFIPESERAKEKLTPGYQPSTLLLDEVKQGQTYEIVVTNLLGGAFVRYRLGDIVTITGSRNDKLDIDIPQMAFYSRTGSLIDLAGFTRLTESTIGHAIEAAGIPVHDWVARKEIHDQEATLHLYIEPLTESCSSEHDMAEAVHQQLKQLDEPYSDVEEMLKRRPIAVTVLPCGSFSSYTSRQREDGADLAHLRPPHMNPSDVVIAALLRQVPEETRVTVT